MRTKGLTTNAAWKLLSDMYYYTDDDEWEREMVDALTETPLSPSMAKLVERWLAIRKDKYRKLSTT